METKWHKDTIEIWSKSTAKSLFSIMSIDPIRDEVMYWLTPRDAVEFTVATGILFSEEDMAKYTNIFKQLISNRRWLLNMISEGYQFTAVGTYLDSIADSKMHKDPDRVAFMCRVIDVILFVTKNEKFIPCTDLFMPTHLTMRVVRNELSIRILCPIESGSTDVPMFLSPSVYDMALVNAFDGPYPMDYSIKYAHMVNDRCRIVGPITGLGNKMSTIQDTVKKLFSITATSSDYASLGTVHININRHSSMYSK
ncbi:hypothetical protein LTR75_012926 [Friedmanniomyces endolithicus]|nr:hypothetical protein LTR75_012926 [Friedmanniomyces endolithicus]